jgi:hypothetical protein
MSQLKIRKFTRVCRRLRHRRDATRLWNLIDHMERDAEVLWGLMAYLRPEFFLDPRDANSVVFTYDSDN